MVVTPPATAGDPTAAPAEQSLRPEGLDPITAALLDRVNPAGGGTAHSNGSDSPASKVRVLSSDEPAASPPQNFQAIVRQTVLDSVRAHADAEPDVEICGVMVGTLYEKPESAFVHIDDVIRGDHASGRGTHVTFTAETWQHIHKEMDEKHPGKQIVGWYHSHPGFGIFLSEMDLFIQRHFFNAPWQTALVYDPQSKERGLFAWRGGDTQRIEFVVDDGHGSMTPEGDAATKVSSPDAEADHAAVPSASLAAVMERMERVESRQRWIYAACGLLALVAVIWPLVVLVVISPMERSPQQKPAVQQFPTLPDVPASTVPASQDSRPSDR